jgi:hypothetical protein
MGGIFSSVRNLIMTLLNRVSSQPSISTGAKLELWVAVGSRLHMVKGRYHIAVCNWFYRVVTVIINITEKAKLVSPTL